MFAIFLYTCVIQTLTKKFQSCHSFVFLCLPNLIKIHMKPIFGHLRMFLHNFLPPTPKANHV